MELLSLGILCYYTFEKRDYVLEQTFELSVCLYVCLSLLLSMSKGTINSLSAPFLVALSVSITLSN